MKTKLIEQIEVLIIRKQELENHLEHYQRRIDKTEQRLSDLVKIIDELQEIVLEEQEEEQTTTYKDVSKGGC